MGKIVFAHSDVPEYPPEYPQHGSVAQYKLDVISQNKYWNK